MQGQSEQTASALTVVTAHLDAQRSRDLDAVRASLSDTFAEHIEHAPTRDADALLDAFAASWRATTMQTLFVDEINLVDDEIVTVRYRAIPIADPAKRVRRDVPSILGYAVHEVRDGRIATTWRYEVPLSSPAATTRSSTAMTEPADDAEAATHDGPASTPRERSLLRRVAVRVLAVLAFAVALLVNELVLSTPVIAMTTWVGGPTTFAVLVPIYSAIGFGLAFVVLSRCRRSVAPGRLERFVTADAERPQLQRIRRLVQAGTSVGFVLSSVIFASPATVWLLWQVGFRKRANLLALVSSTIFAAVFVASYAGFTSLFV